MSDSPSLDQQLAFAKELALEAGVRMLKYFRSDAIGTIWKEDDTPLTVADTEINKLVIAQSRERFPDYGVLGEEESFGEGREWMWVCDPIDGTMPYSLGLPVSTFSLALTRNGIPQLGVVYDPFFRRLFHAQLGKGAFLNDQPIKVSDKTMKNSYVVLEVWAKHKGYNEKLLPLYGLREMLLDLDAQPITYSSCILMGSLIANGDISGLIFGVTKPEDIAALKVIVEEAGGRVTDIDGRDQRYDCPTNGAIVSNGVIHDQLLELVRRARPHSDSGN